VIRILGILDYFFNEPPDELSGLLAKRNEFLVIVE
jgi:hypothetical protein